MSECVNADAGWRRVVRGEPGDAGIIFELAWYLAAAAAL